MTDNRSNHRAAPDGPVNMDEVVRTAGEVADRLREAASAVARLGERELAMLVDVGEEVRDTVVAKERLASARRRETVDGLRRSAHRGVDLGFDAAAVAVDVGVDVLDVLLRRPRADFALDGQPAAAVSAET